VNPNEVVAFYADRVPGKTSELLFKVIIFLSARGADINKNAGDWTK